MWQAHLMGDNVYKFRRIKWGDPNPKLKVLVEDFQRRLWVDRLPLPIFTALVILASLATFFVVFLMVN